KGLDSRMHQGQRPCPRLEQSGHMSAPDRAGLSIVNNPCAVGALHTSATGVPVSACFNVNEICSSVKLLFFTAPLLPPGSHKTGKLAFMPEEKNGKRSSGQPSALICRSGVSGMMSR